MKKKTEYSNALKCIFEKLLFSRIIGIFVVGPFVFWLWSAGWDALSG